MIVKDTSADLILKLLDGYYVKIFPRSEIGL